MADVCNRTYIYEIWEYVWRISVSHIMSSEQKIRPATVAGENIHANSDVVICQLWRHRSIRAVASPIYRSPIRSWSPLRTPAWLRSDRAMISVRKIKRNSATNMGQFALYRVIFTERDAIAKSLLAEQRKESSKHEFFFNFNQRILNLI